MFDLINIIIIIIFFIGKVYYGALQPVLRSGSKHKLKIKDTKYIKYKK